MQDSKQEKKYACEKCARTYTQKHNLTVHQKFECGVMPQFECQFCGKRFKQKHHMNTHIGRVHQPTNSNTPQERYNCDECSRSYSYSGGLSLHKRLKHSEVKPQFICNYCGYKTNLKYNLSKHITLRHLRLKMLRFDSDSI